MKVKAMKNISGVLSASIGEEFEVKNEAILRDLLTQGLAVPVESNPQQVQSMMHQVDEQKLYADSSMAAKERAMKEEAFSEAVQKEVNNKAEQLKQLEQDQMNQFKQQAEQQVQQQMQQQSNQQNQPSAQASQQNSQSQSQQKSQGINPQSH